jgi:Putative auto-transporter adhesin, head GIN domain
MKKIIFAVILLVACNKIFSQQFSDSNAQVRVAKDFHSIKVSQAFDIYLTQGSKESVAVRARDKKYLSQIKTEVKDGQLRIWHDGGNIHDWNTKKMKLKVYVSFIGLDKIDASQGCHVYAVGDWKDNALKKKLLEN